MLQRLTKKIKSAVWPKLSRNLPRTCQVSYSQFGEDMVLAWLFRHMSRPGFYVDIGAFHPIFLSNTYALYCKGWRGVCVEPRVAVADEFRLFRPRDITLSMAITPNRQDAVEFFQFEEPTLNTVDADEARMIQDRGVRLVERRSVPAITLADVFERHAPPCGRIDLLSIDVEGLDEAILQSHDWSRVKPMVVVFESRGRSVVDVPDLPVVQDLKHSGYEIVSKCGESLIARHTATWEESVRQCRLR